jgi:hypothetical protein
MYVHRYIDGKELTAENAHQNTIITVVSSMLLHCTTQHTLFAVFLIPAFMYTGGGRGRRLERGYATSLYASKAPAVR